MSYVLLAAAILLAVLARSATRGVKGQKPVWVLALVGSEAAGPLAFVSLGLAAGVAFREWAGGPAGSVAVWLLVLAAAGFLLALTRGFLTRPIFRAALRDAVDTPAQIRIPFAGALAPVAIRPRRVTVTEHRYGPHQNHVLDVMAAGSGTGRPILVYVHGGGWWRGRRGTQGLPIRHALAAAGWVVCAPGYRLSPEATFPDHLIDVKRAIAWVREHADELGGDPDFIAIMGGSTGGNLAALAALSHETSLQPGFETADTSVQACVPLYGVHDLVRSSGDPLWPYLVKSVMKTHPSDDPEHWRQASPARLDIERRPPFFVLHGAADTLVRPELSRRLVENLANDAVPVHYVEVPWATHGFDFFAGPRGRMAADVIAQVLDHYRAGGR